jgi:hypothetical protein
MDLKAAMTVPLNPHSSPIRTSACGDMVEIMHGRLMPMRFACAEKQRRSYLQHDPATGIAPEDRAPVEPAPPP